MGGGLLQKVNRDTMSFATKLSHVVYADGTKADIMKSPTGDTSKISFPGDTYTPPACHALYQKCILWVDARKSGNACNLGVMLKTSCHPLTIREPYEACLLTCCSRLTPSSETQFCTAFLNVLGHL